MKLEQTEREKRVRQDAINALMRAKESVAYFDHYLGNEIENMIVKIWNS